METKKVELTPREKKVLDTIKAAKEPVTIKDVARDAFPGVRPFAKAYSWTRNQLRRLRDDLKLVKKVSRGTYRAN